MSCETLNLQGVSLNVAMGSLPEGFCPASMQELGDAIAARLIVTPSQSFNSFAIGSVAPTSNIGPWLRDCLTWYVYDDATASYVPMRFGFMSEVVGIFIAETVLAADVPLVLNTWVDIVSVTTPRQGGTVHVTTNGVLKFLNSGDQSYAFRITDGTDEWPVTFRNAGTTSGSDREPIAIDFYETLGANQTKTYTLQVSQATGDIAPQSILASDTQGGQTVTGITRITVAQFISP